MWSAGLESGVARRRRVNGVPLMRSVNGTDTGCLVGSCRDGSHAGSGGLNPPRHFAPLCRFENRRSQPSPRLFSIGVRGFAALPGLDAGLKIGAPAVRAVVL